MPRARRRAARTLRLGRLGHREVQAGLVWSRPWWAAPRMPFRERPPSTKYHLERAYCTGNAGPSRGPGGHGAAYSVTRARSLRRCIDAAAAQTRQRTLAGTCLSFTLPLAVSVAVPAELARRLLLVVPGSPDPSVEGPSAESALTPHLRFRLLSRLLLLSSGH